MPWADAGATLKPATDTTAEASAARVARKPNDLRHLIREFHPFRRSEPYWITLGRTTPTRLRQEGEAFSSRDTQYRHYACTAVDQAEKTARRARRAGRPKSVNASSATGSGMEMPMLVGAVWLKLLARSVKSVRSTVAS